MDVEKVQDRGKSTLVPSTEVRKHGSEVSQWNHIQSVRRSTTCARADGVIELHVDDGHGCGKETVIAELLTFLSEKIEMKYMQGIWCGSYEHLKTVKVRDGKKLTSIPNKKHFQSALKKLEMSDCKGSVSPKLDKACIDCDNEELSEEHTSRFRFSVLTLLYLSNERTDIQSTVRLLCTKLKSPTALEMR